MSTGEKRMEARGNGHMGRRMKESEATNKDGFVLLNFTVFRYWNTFLNKCGYIAHHFKAHFLLYVILLMTLLSVYFIFILDYGNYIRQKANSSNFLIQIQNGL